MLDVTKCLQEIEIIDLLSWVHHFLSYHLIGTTLVMNVMFVFSQSFYAKERILPPLNWVCNGSRKTSYIFLVARSLRGGGVEAGQKKNFFCGFPK